LQFSKFFEIFRFFENFRFLHYSKFFDFCISIFAFF
jgi:hypothetical protein